mgnify:CR=1 FL=1
MGGGGGDPSLDPNIAGIWLDGRRSTLVDLALVAKEKMRLILHIGTAKTGTTTLQRWLSTNRDALKSQGIWYAKSLGSPSNRKISICCRDADKPDDGFWQNGITNPEQHRKFCAQVKEDFDRELEAAFEQKCKYFIISNEHLQSRLTSENMVRRVQDFVGHSFQSIQVIVHFRPQIDTALSRASTASKSGGKVNYQWFQNIDPNNHFYNYLKLINYWESVFGSENVQVLPFKQKPCITSFLIDFLDINTKNLTDIKRANEAIDVRTMALINAINIPRFDSNKKPNKNRTIFIDKLPNKEKLAIGLKLAKSVQKKFNEVNAELASRRKDIEFEDLQPDWKKYNTAANIDILDYQCPFSEQLNALVQIYNGELKLERARTRIAESERAFARRNFQNANNFLEKALQLLRDAEQVKEVNAQVQDLMKKVDKMKHKINDPNWELEPNRFLTSNSANQLSFKNSEKFPLQKNGALYRTEENLEKIRVRVSNYKKELESLIVEK